MMCSVFCVLRSAFLNLLHKYVKIGGDGRGCMGYVGRKSIDDNDDSRLYIK